MKKLSLLIFVFWAFNAMQAQWVDDPMTNTFLANTSADAGEVYLATSDNGDIFIQWSQFGPNGWSPTLQRLNALGEPQWNNGGIHPSYHAMASWSQGFAMAATSDNAVVTCFSTEAGNTVAIKINADGTYAWGEEGHTLFNGHGNSRTELLSGDDGGVWALGTDYDDGNTYVCYIGADGTLNPTITISDDGGKLCMFSQMVPANDGGVFVVYEKESWAYTYYYEKEIWVEGYTKDGEQFSAPTRLMAPQTIGGSYCHYVVPDGLGGGYAYIWHPAIGESFNTYVFHFDQYGASTITDINGVSVHSTDPANFYLDAYAAVDPVSHDLVIVYVQTDVIYQSESRVYANRINLSGERLWGEGIVIVDENGNNHSDLLIDAFDYGGGYSIIYNEGDGYYSTVKAIGIDDEGNRLWATTMSSNSYPRSMCENTTGFHGGMNVVAWVNATNNGAGGLYGQNIGWDGGMGDNIMPIPPVTTCYPPTDLQGSYFYDDEVQVYGALISWTSPETLPLHYNLYCEGAKEVIEVDAEATSYFDEKAMGDYIYKLTAVYEDCESEFALTASGADYVRVQVTSVDENELGDIVNILRVYTLNGQLVRCQDLTELSKGMYVLQGLTREGRLVTRKKCIR